MKNILIRLAFLVVIGSLTTSVLMAGQFFQSPQGIRLIIDEKTALRVRRVLKFSDTSRPRVYLRSWFGQVTQSNDTLVLHDDLSGSAYTLPVVADDSGYLLRPDSSLPAHWGAIDRDIRIVDSNERTLSTLRGTTDGKTSEHCQIYSLTGMLSQPSFQKEEDTPLDVTVMVEMCFVPLTESLHDTLTPIIGLENFSFYPSSSKFQRPLNIQANRHYGFHLSASFPERYIPCVRMAMQYWNNLMGQEVLQLYTDNGNEEPSVFDANMIVWRQVDRDSESMTGHFIDPINGTVALGGIDLSSSIVEKARLNRELAIIYYEMLDSSKSEFVEEQDVEKDYLTYVVAHELGHFLGLRHNFSSQISTDLPTLAERRSLLEAYYRAAPLELHPIRSIALSVMGYIPLADSLLIGRQIRLKAFTGFDDQTIVKALYGNYDEKLPLIASDGRSKKFIDGDNIYGTSVVSYLDERFKMVFDYVPAQLVGILRKTGDSKSLFYREIDQWILYTLKHYQDLLKKAYNLTLWKGTSIAYERYFRQKYATYDEWIQHEILAHGGITKFTRQSHHFVKILSETPSLKTQVESLGFEWSVICNKVKMLDMLIQHVGAMTSRNDHCASYEQSKEDQI